MGGSFCFRSALPLQIVWGKSEREERRRNHFFSPGFCQISWQQKILGRGMAGGELTSGAGSRIIPLIAGARHALLFRPAALRLYLFFQSLFLSFLVVIQELGKSSASFSLSAASSPASITSRFRAAARREEEDVRRRRGLAEAVEMETPSATTETFVLVGPRRNSLFCRSWLPASGSLRAILVIIHGLNEHSGRYLHFAEQLTSCNFGVYAMDWIGHGGSDGLHGYVPSLDYVVEDVGFFLEKIKSWKTGVRCFLFGHSTGGAVVLKASLYLQINSMLEGIVLTSPALGVKPAHPIFGAVAPIVSFVAPRLQFKGANRRGIPVSRDPAAMQAKYSDPLVYTGPIRVRTGYQILRLSSYLLKNIKLVTVPFFVLHGTADRVTDPLASQYLYHEAASCHKDIKLYEGLLHDLLFEPERCEIGADIIQWMENKLVTG